MRVDRDRLNTLPTEAVAQRTMQLLDLVQDFTPEEQIASLSATFLLLMERFNVSAQDAFGTTSRIIHHADGTRRPEFAALRQYLREELT